MNHQKLWIPIKPIQWMNLAHLCSIQSGSWYLINCWNTRRQPSSPKIVNGKKVSWDQNASYFYHFQVNVRFLTSVSFAHSSTKEKIIMTYKRSRLEIIDKKRWCSTLQEDIYFFTSLFFLPPFPLFSLSLSLLSCPLFLSGIPLVMSRDFENF